MLNWKHALIQGLGDTVQAGVRAVASGELASAATGSSRGRRRTTKVPCSPCAAAAALRAAKAAVRKGQL